MKILFYAFHKLLCFSSPWIQQCNEFSCSQRQPHTERYLFHFILSAQRWRYFHIPLNLIFHLPGIWAHPYPGFKDITQEPPHSAHGNCFWKPSSRGRVGKCWSYRYHQGFKILNLMDQPILDSDNVSALQLIKGNIRALETNSGNF